MRAAVAVAMTGLLAACAAPAPPPAPPPPPAPAPATTPVPSTAAAWTAAERADAIRSIAERARAADLPPTPAVGAVRPPWYTPLPGRPQLTLHAFEPAYDDDYLPPEGATGEPIDVHDLWLARPAERRVEDGAVKVILHTRRTMAGGLAAFGARVFGSRAYETVFRKSARVASDAPGRIHSARYPLERLLKPKYDINGIRTSGRGTVSYRVSLLDLERRRARWEDGRVALRCAPVPCEADATWTQLPTIELGPIVDLVGTSSATISFVTDVPTVAEVRVKGRDGAIRGFSGAGGAMRHEVTVRGLRPGARHRYLVAVADARGEVSLETQGTLRTADTGPRVRFAVLSDARGAPGGAEYHQEGVNRRVLAPLIGEAARQDVDLVVFAGDLIEGYTTVPAYFARQMEAFARAVEPFAMHLPIYEGIGNHEVLGDAWSEGWVADHEGAPNSQTAFADAVVNPSNGPAPEPGGPPYDETAYSFTRNGVHFVMINSNYRHRNKPARDDHPAADRGGYRQGWVSDHQLAWLAQDLAAARARGARHIFAFTHEPAFPNGGHRGDGMYWDGDPKVTAQRDKLWRLFERFGVRALFTGDEHNYSRMVVDASVLPFATQAIPQVVTGGAGAPYYQQDDSVPWAGAVKTFDVRHHVCVVEVDGPRVTLEVYDVNGEVVDRADLSGPTVTAPGR